MNRFFVGTRYLIIIPVIGLGLAAAAFFFFGGINLIRFLVEVVGEALGLIEVHHDEEINVVIEVVEFVHTFLIGTVLYITSIGFYQLFIGEIEFPGWLKIHNTEELETSLIGVTVVVLAVNFLGVVFTGESVDMIAQGAGIALPIAALALFIAARAWSTRQEREAKEHDKSESGQLAPGKPEGDDN
jgi:uncharacterized membrane protein YqhA